MPDTTVTSDTGASDPNSLYGSGLLNSLEQYAGFASKAKGFLDTITGSDTKPAATTATTAPATDWQKYLPWIGGGLALILVLALVMRGK